MIAIKEQEPVVIGGVISTLYKVKLDLEVLGNELAGHQEEWCALQLRKLVSLYSTLDESIINLKQFVKFPQEALQSHERMKSEDVNEFNNVPENKITDFKDDLYNPCDTGICHESLDHEAEENEEFTNHVKLENKVSQISDDDVLLDQESQLMKIEVDPHESMELDDPLLSKPKKSSKSSKLKRDIKVITEKIDHDFDNIELEHLNCSECSYTGVDLISFKNHMNRLHPKVVYLCVKCDYKGATLTNVKDHYQSMHRGVWYPCQHCDYTSKRSGDLKKHVDSVHGNPRYKCSECDFECRTKQYMQTHERFVHKDKGHKCQLCSFSGKYPKNLRDHVDAVHSNSIYQCDECEYTCISMKMLGQHYTTKHKNKEELLCSKCPYKTFADRYLKNHMKTHMEDEKRLVYCSQCQYSTKNSFTLRKHIAKKHSIQPPKQKEYYCELCEYISHDKNTLNQHREFKHEGIMHGCPVCGLKYSRASLVYRHMRRKHPAVDIPISNVGNRKNNSLVAISNKDKVALLNIYPKKKNR